MISAYLELAVGTRDKKSNARTGDVRVYERFNMTRILCLHLVLYLPEPYGLVGKLVEVHLLMRRNRVGLIVGCMVQVEYLSLCKYWRKRLQVGVVYMCDPQAQVGW